VVLLRIQILVVGVVVRCRLFVAVVGTAAVVDGVDGTAVVAVDDGSAAEE